MEGRGSPVVCCRRGAGQVWPGLGVCLYSSVGVCRHDTTTLQAPFGPFSQLSRRFVCAAVGVGAWLGAQQRAAVRSLYPLPPGLCPRSRLPAARASCCTALRCTAPSPYPASAHPPGQLPVAQPGHAGLLSRIVIRLHQVQDPAGRECSAGCRKRRLAGRACKLAADHGVHSATPVPARPPAHAAPPPGGPPEARQQQRCPLTRRCCGAPAG